MISLSSLKLGTILMTNSGERVRLMRQYHSKFFDKPLFIGGMVDKPFSMTYKDDGTVFQGYTEFDKTDRSSYNLVKVTKEL